MADQIGLSSRSWCIICCQALPLYAHRHMRAVYFPQWACMDGHCSGHSTCFVHIHVNIYLLWSCLIIGTAVSFAYSEKRRWLGDLLVALSLNTSFFCVLVLLIRPIIRSDISMSEMLIRPRQFRTRLLRVPDPTHSYTQVRLRTIPLV